MKAALATLCLLSALAVQATPAIEPPAASDPLPGHGNVGAEHGVPPGEDIIDEPLVPPREATIAVLKEACASRAERVVRLTAPEALSDPALVPGICACTAAALDATAPDVFVDTLPEVAERATLSCARPAVTAHNQSLTRLRFSEYLTRQGWTDAQMDTFSLCLSQGYWQDTADGVLQGRPSRLKGSVLWADCAARAGEAGTPMPTLRPGTHPGS